MLEPSHSQRFALYEDLIISSPFLALSDRNKQFGDWYPLDIVCIANKSSNNQVKEHERQQDMTECRTTAIHRKYQQSINEFMREEVKVEVLSDQEF